VEEAGPEGFWHDQARSGRDPDENGRTWPRSNILVSWKQRANMEEWLLQEVQVRPARVAPVTPSRSGDARAAFRASPGFCEKSVKKVTYAMSKNQKIFNEVKLFYIKIENAGS
jgi:hypothetical protein